MEYTAIIKKDNGAYLVFFPDFENVHTYGETLKEAVKNAEEALNGCIESDFERGFSLPIPSKINRKNAHAINVCLHIEVAYQLRKLRNGRSQSEIAKELGVSYQAYQKLENPRKCNPTLKTLEKIQRVFHKDLHIVWG